MLDTNTNCKHTIGPDHLPSPPSPLLLFSRDGECKQNKEN